MKPVLTRHCEGTYSYSSSSQCDNHDPFVLRQSVRIDFSLSFWFALLTVTPNKHDMDTP